MSLKGSPVVQEHQLMHETLEVLPSIVVARQRLVSQNHPRDTTLVRPLVSPEGTLISGTIRQLHLVVIKISLGLTQGFHVTHLIHTLDKVIRIHMIILLVVNFHLLQEGLNLLIISNRGIQITSIPDMYP